MFQQLFWQLQQIDAFTIYVSGAMAVAAFLFFREIANSPGLAIVSFPIIMAGGIVSAAAFQGNMIVLSYDRDANVAAAVGIGVILALMLLIAIKFLWTFISEKRVAGVSLPEVAPKARAVRRSIVR